jgi:hypothetical protein
MCLHNFVQLRTPFGLLFSTTKAGAGRPLLAYALSGLLAPPPFLLITRGDLVINGHFS